MPLSRELTPETQHLLERIYHHSRFMKYDWIENVANENWRSLKNHVEKVLGGFGKEFVINFA